MNAYTQTLIRFPILILAVAVIFTVEAATPESEPSHDVVTYKHAKAPAPTKLEPPEIAAPMDELHLHDPARVIAPPSPDPRLIHPVAPDRYSKYKCPRRPQNVDIAQVDARASLGALAQRAHVRSGGCGA